MVLTDSSKMRLRKEMIVKVVVLIAVGKILKISIMMTSYSDGRLRIILPRSMKWLGRQKSRRGKRKRGERKALNKRSIMIMMQMETLLVTKRIAMSLVDMTREMSISTISIERLFFLVSVILSFGRLRSRKDLKKPQLLHL